MNKSPEISCIVPVYKTEKYLQKCVDSILSQTFTDFELILVDDGSPDGCPKICDEYAMKDERVKVIHKKNGGSASARNAGIDSAKGKFIYFCDSDDWIENDLMETFVNVQRETDADVVVCSFFNEWRESQEIFELPKYVDTEESFRQWCKGELPSYIPIKFVSKSIYENEGCRCIDGIDVWEDQVLSAKILYYAKKIFYVNKPLYHYNRCNENSLTSAGGNGKTEQMVAAMNEVERFLMEKENDMTGGGGYICLLKKKKAFVKFSLLLSGGKVPLNFIRLYQGENLSFAEGIPPKEKLLLRLCEFNCVVAKVFLDSWNFARKMKSLICSAK